MAWRDGGGLTGGSVVVVGLLSVALTAAGGSVLGSPPEDSIGSPSVLSSDLYPCSQCHADFELDGSAGTGDFHEKAISGHGEPLRSCLDCHAAADMDALRLVGGEPIAFEQVDVLCGQCHGKIYLAWQAGAYGKRTGLWNGEKRYSSCVECHDPHQPTFAAIEPDPPPRRPRETLRRKP